MLFAWGTPSFDVGTWQGWSIPGQFQGTGKLAYDGKTTMLSAWGTPSFDVGTWQGWGS